MAALPILALGMLLESGRAGAVTPQNVFTVADIPLAPGTTNRRVIAQADSPWIIKNAVAIPAGTTLYIEPGSVAKFEVNAGFSILGSLFAPGTAASPILFTSNATNPAPGDWAGLWLETGSLTELSHCVMEYGGSGTMTVSVPDGTLHPITAFGAILPKRAGPFFPQDPARGSFIRPSIVPCDRRPGHLGL